MWQVEWDARALKELKKIDRQAQKDVINFLKKRIATQESPKRFGKALLGNKSGLWRYRIRDYRLICKMEDNKMVVVVLRVGHRKAVYT